MNREPGLGGIEWTGVSKRYGDVTVIPDFSLSIAAGEFVALLGPSGCGKSTLLRMLAGLDPVSSGRITIGGRDVTSLPPGQRGVAMVFQQYALYPHMTVRDNMAFGLRNVRMKEDEIARRVAQASQMLELDALLERKPVQLSGGQRQRVAIGRAVVKEPLAFLFDEPLSNLDAALRTEQFAAPMELYDRPATRFVAGFVGSPAMNFLPVQRAADQDGRCAVRLSDGAVLCSAVAAAADIGAGLLTLGVRPDALTPSEHGQLSGVVEVIERLGDRTLLHVLLADGVLVVADAPRKREPAAGSAVRLQIDTARAHLFDAAGLAHHPS
jgi:multiple sugar transport system ATP-binding protein